jgi:thymidylate synthase (FAD)
MKIIEPSVELYKDKSALDIYKSIERAGRVCYKSEDKITEYSHDPFIRGILKRGHEAVIEHEKVTVKVICDRGVTHEVVRHRLASYCQESTRYCNYSKLGITFIQPDFEFTQDDLDFMFAMENHYNKRISQGLKPQQARYFLINGIKTEIIITFNLREWRHFFKLRCAPTAHPQMKQVADMLLKEMKEYIPLFYEDITY